MRTAPVLAAALALVACTGTEGNVLRTRPDNGASGDAGSPSSSASGAGGMGGANGGSTAEVGAGTGGMVRVRPEPTPLSSWQIQLSGALDTSVDVGVFVA